MSLNYANVDISTDTFTTLITRTNQLLDALKNNIVTVDANTVSGNTVIDGTMTINDLYVDVIYGGEFGNTQPIVFASNTTFSVNATFSDTLNAENVVANSISYTAAAASSNTTTEFLTMSGNTVTKNDITGMKNSLGFATLQEATEQAIVYAVIF
jgi:hypothetical protein